MHNPCTHPCWTGICEPTRLLTDHVSMPLSYIQDRAPNTAEAFPGGAIHIIAVETMWGPRKALIRHSTNACTLEALLCLLAHWNLPVGSESRQFARQQTLWQKFGRLTLWCGAISSWASTVHTWILGPGPLGLLNRRSVSHT